MSAGTSGTRSRTDRVRLRRGRAARLVLAALVLGSSAAVMPSGTEAQAAVATRTLVVTAVADTTVRQAQPTTEFGASALAADAQELSTTGSAVVAYLRFEVPGLSPGETVSAAKLRLRTVPSDGGTGNGPAVWRTKDTSTAAALEALTWNSSRPARRGSTPVGNFGAMAHDANVSTAVHGITGNGLATFELAPESTNGLRAHSREHATAAYRPQLVLTLTKDASAWPKAVGGSWSTPIASLPQQSIHAAVLHTGKVLLVAGSGNRKGTFTSGTFTSLLWDPVTNALTRLPDAPYDFFCGGHSFLPDGRLLVAGGSSVWESSTQRFGGSDRSVLFDPVSATYTSPSTTMAHARWYPTVINTGDGRVLAVSGYRADGTASNTAEFFDIAAGNWTRTLIPQPFANYPHLSLLADGRLFYSGLSHRSGDTKPPGLWDVAGNTFRSVPGLTTPLRRNSGGTVLLPPAQAQKVMVMGGGDRNGAIAEANVVDLKASSPRYAALPKIPFSDGSTGAMHLSAVLLPDGKVLESGGTRSYIRGAAVRSSSTYDPVENTWAQMNPQTRPRGYHSTAVLLPDGRVATFGHDLDDEATFDLSVEVWSPPYLHKGTRPSITATPTKLQRGGSYAVAATASGATLARFVLVRPSAVTHSLDPDQRLVGLGMTRTSTGATVTVPSNRNIVPSGWYMMFAVDSLERPSVAKWVHVA